MLASVPPPELLAELPPELPPLLPPLLLPALLPEPLLVGASTSPVSMPPS
jgi:hypothetical protein